MNYQAAGSEGPCYRTAAVTPDPNQPASVDDAPASSLPPQRSATVALSLSFLWPGLGQAYARHTKRALLFAIPIAIAILAGLVVVAGGVERLAMAILSPTTALAIILVVLIAGAWRILAMSDAVEVTNPRAWRQRSTVAAFGVLTLVTVLIHGALSVGLYSAYDAGPADLRRGPATIGVPGAWRVAGCVRSAVADLGHRFGAAGR